MGGNRDGDRGAEVDRAADEDGRRERVIRERGNTGTG